MVHFFSSMVISSWCCWEGRDFVPDPSLGREMLSLLLSKISMKQLDEVICQFRDWHHQYANGIHQYRNAKV